MSLTTPEAKSGRLTGAHLLVLLDRARESGGLDLFDLTPDLLALRRVKPHILPIAITNAWLDTGADRVEHVLGGVDVRWADSAMAGKVLPDNVRILSNVPEVHGLAAALEQEEPVEALEKQGGRLVW